MMADLATARPVHGGYPQAFPDTDWLPLAREIAAGVCERDGEASIIGEQIRAGQADVSSEVACALAALRWRFYAQPDFRAAVSR